MLGPSGQRAGEDWAGESTLLAGWSTAELGAGVGDGDWRLRAAWRGLYMTMRSHHVGLFSTPTAG